MRSTSKMKRPGNRFAIQHKLVASVMILSFSGLSLSSAAQTRDSLDIKIGQMILMGIPYPKIDTVVLEEVRKGNIGSIILFEKNIPKKTSAFADLKKNYLDLSRSGTLSNFLFPLIRKAAK